MSQNVQNLSRSGDKASVAALGQMLRTEFKVLEGKSLDIMMLSRIMLMSCHRAYTPVLASYNRLTLCVLDCRKQNLKVVQLAHVVSIVG